MHFNIGATDSRGRARHIRNPWSETSVTLYNGNVIGNGRGHWKALNDVYSINVQHNCCNKTPYYLMQDTFSLYGGEYSKDNWTYTLDIQSPLSYDPWWELWCFVTFLPDTQLIQVSVSYGCEYEGKLVRDGMNDSTHWSMPPHRVTCRAATLDKSEFGCNGWYHYRVRMCALHKQSCLSVLEIEFWSLFIHNSESLRESKVKVYSNSQFCLENDVSISEGKEAFLV